MMSAIHSGALNAKDDELYDHRDAVDLPFANDSASILDQLQLFPLPVPPTVTPRPITEDEKTRIATLSELQFFLATAPTRWNSAESMPTTNLTKFQLPNGEYVSCILWNGLYHITGTDIVRALSFRFEAFGRPVKATKKWEEGVFSDLRNLKPGLDASLEEPKSPLLDFLFRNGCIRTQKKQKVFYWFSVPHDRLFLDALERDLKREKVGQTPTTEVMGEPARSFRYDPRRSLYEQFAANNPGLDSSLINQVTPSLEFQNSATSSMTRPSPSLEVSHAGFYPPPVPSATALSDPGVGAYGMSPVPNSAVTFQRTLFEGSPAYKKRRVRSRQGTSPSVLDENGLRRASSTGRSFTSDMRSGTISPRLSHAVLRKVSGNSERGASPAGLKRERDESVAPDLEIEAGEKVFVCAFEFCRRPFKRLEHLKRHVRTHTQERPFACDKCTRSFSRQDNLTQHLRTHGRLDEINGGTSTNVGLGLGTPPPREGVDYYVATAVPGGMASAVAPGFRWATASPAGDGGQPYRIAGSMPPPSLPYSSRHSTAPPDWGHSVGQGSYIAQPDFSYPEPSGMRRFRSVTPSAIYQPTNIPAGTVSGPVPLGWGPAPPQQMAPYQFSYWRPPSEMQYTVPMTPSIATPVGDTPVMNGYDMAAQTPITYVDPSTESYPTPTAE